MVPNFARRVFSWFKLFAEYTLAHILTKAFASVSAIALIRMLSIEEYAVYTLFLSAITFISIFSDSGATQTLSYFRWRVVKKKQLWLPYLQVILKFRRFTFFLGYFFATVYIWKAGGELNITYSSKIVGVILIGIGGWFGLQSSLITYAFKLKQQFYLAYAIELANEVIKLFVIIAILLIGIKTALGGIVSAALGALVAALISTTLLLRSNSGKSLALSPRQMAKGSKVLLCQVLPLIPASIHFAAQGMVVAWLAVYYGSAENLAEIGALARLGALIAVLGGFTSSVFVPKLVSISIDKKFFKMYLIWWLVILIFGAAILLLIRNYPIPLLSILGSSYLHLKYELLVTAATAVFSIYSMYAWCINRSRGWVKYQPYRVPFVLLGQCIMFAWLDFSTTFEVLVFGLGTMILDAVFQTVLNFQGYFSKDVTANLTTSRRGGL